MIYEEMCLCVVTISRKKQRKLNFTLAITHIFTELCLSLFLPCFTHSPPPVFLQLISEFVIAEIRPEDGGSFYCSAANPAGVATANFTIIVTDAAPSSRGAGIIG